MKFWKDSLIDIVTVWLCGVLVSKLCIYTHVHNYIYTHSYTELGGQKEQKQVI